MNKKSFILHKQSGLIECEGVSTVLERKIYDILLFIARKQYYYKDDEYWNAAGFDGQDRNCNADNYFKLKNNEFKISIKELKIFFSMFGTEINEADVYSLIWSLHKRELKFNILGKDKSFAAWRFTTALPELEIGIAGEIKYSLPSLIFKELSQQNSVSLLFAKLNLSICLRLRSKFALILYEFLEDYSESPAVPKITIPDLKKLFGLKENYAFYDIVRKCLAPAITEINKNQNIPFSAAYDIIRNGQTPTAVKFTIKNQEKKAENSNNNDNLNEKSITPKNKNSVLVTKNHTLNQEQEQNQKLKENNMTDSNMNGVHVRVPEPEWEPTAEQREKARAYLASYPNTPQREILRKRYQI